MGVDAERSKTPRHNAGRSTPGVSTMAERKKKGQGTATPVAPYLAVGLSTVVYGIGRAEAHRREPQDHRGRHPRRHVGGEHQHAGEAHRSGRGRPHRLHRRGLRPAARDRRPRPLHRHPRARRPSGSAGLAKTLRHPHHRASARRAGPRSWTTATSTPSSSSRPDGKVVHKARQEPRLVPRALLHAPRRLRPLGRAVRRRASRPSIPVYRSPTTSATSAPSAAATVSTRKRYGPSPSTAPRWSTGRAKPCP